MKLAVITDEISQDIEIAARWMVENCVEGAEIRSVDGVNVSEFDHTLITKCKKTLNDFGLTCCGIASPFYKCNYPETRDEWEKQLQLLKNCLKIANELETPLVRVFAFLRDMNPEALLSIIPAAFDAPIMVAKEFGVTLILENEYSCMAGTGKETGDLLAKINSEQVNACWDPGNAYFLDDVPFPDGFEAIKPYLAHVHIKDAATESGEKQFIVVGEGEIDYVGQFKALREMNFTGFLSLETHAKIVGLSPAETSRQCILGIRRLLGESD